LPWGNGLLYKSITKQTFSVNWVIFNDFIGTQEVLSYIRVEGKESSCLISGTVSIEKHFSNVPLPPRKTPMNDIISASA